MKTRLDSASAAKNGRWSVLTKFLGCRLAKPILQATVCMFQMLRPSGTLWKARPRNCLCTGKGSHRGVDSKVKKRLTSTVFSDRGALWCGWQCQETAYALSRNGIFSDRGFMMVWMARSRNGLSSVRDALWCGWQGQKMAYALRTERRPVGNVKKRLYHFSHKTFGSSL